MTTNVKLTPAQIVLLIEALDTITYANSDVEFIKGHLRRSTAVTITVPKGTGIRI